MNSISTTTKGSIKVIINRIRKSKLDFQAVDEGEKSLNLGYETLIELSRKGNIESIQFSDKDNVLTLREGRNDCFDPTDTVMRMYTVPQIGAFEPKETIFLGRFIMKSQVCSGVGASFGWNSVLFL